MKPNVQKFYYHLELADQAFNKAKRLREEAVSKEKEHELHLISARSYCDHDYRNSGSYEAICTNCGDSKET